MTSDFASWSKRDWAEAAFGAGRQFDASSSGVANARVVAYGLSKWLNSFPPGYPPRGKGISKPYLLKSFREGMQWDLSKKRNPSVKATIATLKRDVWVPAKVMVTKAGKILAKVAGSVTKPKRNPNSFGSKVRAYQTKLSPNRVNVYVDNMGEYVVTYERRDGIKGEEAIKYAKQLQVADNYARSHARKYLK